MSNHKERSYRIERRELIETSLRVLIVKLRVIRPVLIAKSKGERSFEVHQVEPQERRRSARKHYVDSQPPKMRRNRPESGLFIKREAWRALFASCPLRYIPQRRVISKVPEQNRNAIRICSNLTVFWSPWHGSMKRNVPSPYLHSFWECAEPLWRPLNLGYVQFVDFVSEEPLGTPSDKSHSKKASRPHSIFKSDTYHFSIPSPMSMVQTYLSTCNINSLLARLWS